MRTESIRTWVCLALGILATVLSHAPSQSCAAGETNYFRRTFWITEFGTSYRFDAQPTTRSWGAGPKYDVTGELGPMFNLNKRTALGGTIFLGLDDDGWRLGVKPRYRCWLNHSMSVDLSPGLLFAGNNNQFHMNQPGFVGHVGLGFKDWVALYGQMEVVRLDAVGTDVGWYGGVKLGSRPGCVAALAALVLYSVALTTIDTGFH